MAKPIKRTERVNRISTRTQPIEHVRPTPASWYALVGRAIVSFGTLERVTLRWAVALGLDHQRMLALHKDDMKKFAPALRTEVRKFEHRLHRPIYERARKAIDAAESLIQSRNDVAHGWLHQNNGTIAFFLAKTVRNGKMVFAARGQDWLMGVIAQTDSALSELVAAMDDAGKQLGISAEAE